MKISVLRSKLHRATVTDADLEYEGSISVCKELLKVAGLHLYEKVSIYNINNGARFSTYIIEGKKGEICLNGAAARHAHRGDKVIIVAYGMIDENEINSYQPCAVLLGDNNTVKEVVK